MTDPLERLETLKEKISEAKTRKRLGDSLEAAVQAVKEAEQSISRLETLGEITPLVSDHLDPLDRQELERFLKTIQEVAQRLVRASDAEMLVEAAKSVPLRLTPAIAQADQYVVRGWKTKIDRAFASMGQLGTVLVQIPEAENLGREMEALSERARTLAQSVTDGTEATAGFSALVADRDRINEKLASLGAGQAVVDFLLAVAGQCANLTHVTTEVRDWIDERQALERFKIGL